MVSLSAIILTSILTAPSNTVLLEFSSPDCHYCRVMQTTVERLREKGYPVRVVNVEREPELARKYRARFLPTFVLVSDGREIARHEGATSFSRLTGMFDKLNAADSTAGGSDDIVRGQSPAGLLPSLPLPKLKRTIEKPTPPSAEDRPHLVDRSIHSTITEGNGRPSGSSENADLTLGPEQLAMQATVRIKVIEEGGHSYGTGTIVDAHGPYALIITCGHLFRDVGMKARIEVELVDQQGVHRTVAGKVVTFDADERDIGLVEIQPGVAVRPVAVAKNERGIVVEGRSVFSIGCDHGADPTLIRSRITKIDRYMGFPNIEVAGQPVVGRSGGGLFSADGALIGVCNAADDEYDEGIYAGLPMIHEELAAVGITPQTRSTALANRDPQPDSGPLDHPLLTAAVRPTDPMNVQPVAVSQVICIVRTAENPQGEVVVIDNPSPELLAKIRQPTATRTAHLDDTWRPVPR
ncbi:MAG TPA: hypothetical protein EYG57_13300 [Planctomycetes bacterium]|nr:hypothetical protein [Planctomycetota bacterium]